MKNYLYKIHIFFFFFLRIYGISMNKKLNYHLFFSLQWNFNEPQWLVKIGTMGHKLSCESLESSSHTCSVFQQTTRVRFWLPIKTTMTQGILFLVNFSPDLRNQIHIFLLRPGVVDALKSTTMKLHFFFRCFE